jgi:hypothetical protein
MTHSELVPFKVWLSTAGKSPAVIVEGEIGVATARWLDTALAEAIRIARTEMVVIFRRSPLWTMQGSVRSCTVRTLSR